jgi:hypothetical protein
VSGIFEDLKIRGFGDMKLLGYLKKYELLREMKNEK